MPTTYPFQLVVRRPAGTVLQGCPDAASICEAIRRITKAYGEEGVPLDAEWTVEVPDG